MFLPETHCCVHSIPKFDTCQSFDEVQNDDLFLALFHTFANINCIKPTRLHVKQCKAITAHDVLPVGARLARPFLLRSVPAAEHGRPYIAFSLRRRWHGFAVTDVVFSKACVLVLSAFHIHGTSGGRPLQSLPCAKGAFSIKQIPPCRTTRGYS